MHAQTDPAQAAPFEQPVRPSFTLPVRVYYEDTDAGGVANVILPVGTDIEALGVIDVAALASAIPKFCLARACSPMSGIGVGWSCSLPSLPRHARAGAIRLLMVMIVLHTRLSRWPNP